MKRILLTLIASAAVGASSFGAAIDFDMKDPKGVNNIVFLLDAPLEQINGTAKGITGNVSFDPAHPDKTTGKIVVEVASLSVANGMMGDHIQGGNWMGAEEHPEMVFELGALTDIKQNGTKVSGTAHGTMTIKGMSKHIDVPVSLTYLEGMLKKRGGRVDGDLLVVRSSFTISRSDYGINSGKNEEKVSDEIELRLTLAGSAPKS